MTSFLFTTNVVDIIRNLNHLKPQQDKAKERKTVGEKMVERGKYSIFIVQKGGLNRRDEP